MAFSVQRIGSSDLYSVPVDGSSPPEELFSDGIHDYDVTSWSSDGRYMAYEDTDPETGRDLWVLSLDGEPTPSPFLVGPFREHAGTFSPDGRWLAYVSNESGVDEVYVRPYPGPGSAVIVSNRGGTEPVWARDGTELFYRKGDEMLAARVEKEPSFAARAAQVLFEGDYALGFGSPNYDVSPDGQQFVMVRRAGEGERALQINVVQNWLEELKRLVPTDN